MSAAPSLIVAALVRALLVLLLAASPAMGQGLFDEPPNANRPASPLDAQTLDWGPLSVRSHAMLFHQRLSYIPGRTTTLDDQGLELFASLSHTNLWAQMPTYFFDAEITRYSLQAAFGLGKHVELGLEWSLYWRGGGLFDAFIMGFHDLFGITQARRQNFPKDRLRVETLDGATTTVQLDDGDEGSGLGNPIVRLRYAPLKPYRWRPAITFEVAMKLPLGDTSGAFATRGFDFLFAFSYAQPILKVVQVFFSIGLIWSPGNETVLGVPLIDLQKYVLVGLELRLLRNLTVVFHYLNQDGIGRGRFVPLTLSTNEFVLGLKWAPETNGRAVVELGLIENSIHDANTPDFGFHLALRWRLD